jgi:hypothetical protein
MRPALVFLFLLAMFSVYAAQAADDTGCPACAELAGRPRAQMTAMVDSGAKMLEITAYYENLTASPARQPLNNSVLILQVSPVKSEAQLLRIYTDATGKAKYNFQQFTTGGYADQCVQFKIVYCPFCIPETTECGFEACMNFSRITTAAKKVSEIKNAPDAVPPAALNGEKFLPSAASAAYCPPPPTGAETPALCLPLIIVFSLLSGALYATGRNPFAGFDFSGARMGGIPARYQPRGRGVAVSSMAVASAASSIGGAAKTKKDAEAKAKAEGKSAAEAKKAGWAALAGQEKAMAKGRVFLLGGMSRAKETVKALRSSKTAAAEAVKRAETKKGAPLSGMERRAVVGKAMAGHIDARLAGMGGLGGGGAKETATGKGSIFAPITGAVIRGSEIAHVSTSKSFMGQWMGTMFGTLGKAALVMTLNSQPVQLIDAFRYAFTPTGSHKSLYELVGLVNNEKRAIADLESLSLMKKGGGATIPRGQGKAADRRQRPRAHSGQEGQA